MSPIACLRNRHHRAYNRGLSSSAPDMQFPPSLRMSNPIHRLPHSPSRAGVYGYNRARYSRGDPFNRNKPRMMKALKRGGFKVTIPKIKDINKIDKYSRVIFPVAYLIFNIIYWTFYTI